MDKPQFLTKTKFDTFDLPEAILKGLAKTGLTHCTPIQAQTLPVSLTGKDVAGQAQTGTGKTAAFLITLLTRLLALPPRESKVPLAMIVAPTRELAFQIYNEAKELGSFTDFTMTAIVGGVDYAKQAHQLEKGVEIIIGTPGRIIDYYKKGILKTESIQIVVIDEADRLLDLGFSKDMRYILKHLPTYEKRQSMLFSATLSYNVMELTYDYMNLPEFISVTPDTVAVEGIEQVLFHVGNDRKFSLLLGLLEREDWVRMLIFVNTKVGVDRLTRRLKLNKYPAEGITGDLPQKKRFELMEQFKSGELKILVATDVASRGIHVEDISHVINYDLPQDSENYVHRIGRTARAGKNGKAISLACEEYVFHLEDLENMLGYKIPVVWAEEDWFIEGIAGPASTRAEKERYEKRPQRNKRLQRSRTKPVPRAEAHKAESHKAEPHRAEPHRAEPRKKTFPGAFFGFGPAPVEEESRPVTKHEAVPEPAPEHKIEPVIGLGEYLEEPPAELPVEPISGEEKGEPAETPPPKKKKRYRRRHKPSKKPVPESSPDAENPPADDSV